MSNEEYQKAIIELLENIKDREYLEYLYKQMLGNAVSKIS